VKKPVPRWRPECARSAAGHARNIPRRKNCGHLHSPALASGASVHAGSSVRRDEAEKSEIIHRGGTLCLECEEDFG